MADFEIEICRTLPEKRDLNDLLAQYYGIVVQRMHDIGFDVNPAAPQSAMAEFWASTGDYLPPTGCPAVVRNPSGQLVGCGMMKRLDAETGELKRDFVTTELRGMGVGRALVLAREREARAMGLRRLVADTMTSNVEMRGLYPKLGFVEQTAPLETTTYKDQPMLRPILHYFVKDL